MRLRYWHGVVLCVVATAAWGGMFPVMAHALPHIDPFTFTCIRYAVAGVLFLGVLLAREGRESLRITAPEAKRAWLFGTAGFAGFQFLVFLGQKLAGPQGALIASIMMVTQPMLGFFVNWVVRKAAPPRAALLFIVLSFAGVTLVITKGDFGQLFAHPASYAPAGMIVLGALCWVIYTVGAAFFPGWSPLRYTTVTTGLGLTSTFSITAILLATRAVPVPSLGGLTAVIPEIAYMGFVAGFIGVLCWNSGNKILTPLNGVLFMDVVPITAFAISTSEGLIPLPVQFAGASLSALALILNNVYLRHRIARPAEPVPAQVTQKVATAKMPAQ
jgi:drug/metabolite transporter (DMT)-like permease